MTGNVSDPVIRRLPGYYRHLRELELSGISQISSGELGRRMQLTSSQIRQDINSIGGFGRQGYGYPVHELKEHIRTIMDLNRKHRMVILGAGRIGNAVSDHPAFAREGFETVAMFDIDSALFREEGGIPVYSMDEMEARLPGMDASIAVLALPADAAQEALERVYALGIRAVWNFAPVDLKHPKDMAVVNVHLSDTLYTLSYRMAHPAD